MDGITRVSMNINGQIKTEDVVGHLANVGFSSILTTAIDG